MIIFVPWIGPSTNAMYAGQHWRVRVRHKNDAIMAVMVALGARYKKFDTPVRIEVQPQLGKGKRSYDVSNYSYSYKLIEDCLVARKVLKNDTADFVRQVDFLAPIRGAETGITIKIAEI